MLYRKLGRTNLDVSVIGLGGEWLNGKTQEVVNEIMDAAMDNGVNYLDIFMPQPEVRKAIGVALKNRRDKMIIQGHLCTVVHAGQYERSRDIVKVKESFGNLLRDLQTDYIDVGMIHYVDTIEDYETVFNGEVIAYAQELRNSGVIKHIGLSSHNPLVALKAIETGLVDVLMFSINPAYDLEKSDTDIFDLMEYKDLNRSDWSIDPARAELYARCESSGVGITVMKALGAGTLLRAESSPFKQAMTVTQCCHYCLDRPAVSCVIIGCSNKEEVLSAVRYCSVGDAERDYTPILSSTNHIRMTGHCMYCNHCQPCPAEIDIAMVTKFLDIAKEHKELPPTVKEHYFALKKNARDCIMCGKCEKNCPFGVRVRQNMIEAEKIFQNS